MHTLIRIALAALLASALIGCGSSEEQASSGGFGFATGPLMRPGDNCLRCHRDERTDYPSAPVWTAAGTVFPGPDSPVSDGVSGVTVLLMDEGGQTVESLVTNAAGNFYTAAPLPAGFRVALEYEGEQIEMPCAPPSGGCAACHNQPAIGGAPGRLFLPQAPEADAIASECGGL
jgi:hypothetical protein